MSNKNQLITVEVKDYAYYREEHRKTVKDFGLKDWIIIQFKLFMGVSTATRVKVVYFLSVTVLAAAILVLNIMSYVDEITPSYPANVSKALKSVLVRDSIIKAQIEASEVKVAPSDMIPPVAPLIKSKPIGAVKAVTKPVTKPVVKVVPTVKKKTVVPANQLQYIQMYKHLAIAEMRRTGVPASITLAQGLIESKHGTSKLAKKSDNHFGIKCPGRVCKYGGGRHCSQQKDDYWWDRFINYQSVEDSFRDHSDFLAGQGRWAGKTNYKRLFKHGRNYTQWAHGLKASGYATCKTYDWDLINIINRLKLYEYDK